MYSHDKTYLPRGEWDDPSWVEEHRKGLRLCGADGDARNLEVLGALIGPPTTGEMGLPRIRDQASADVEMLSAYYAHKNGTPKVLARQPGRR